MAKESVEGLCQKAQRAVAQGDNESARQIYLHALGLKSDAPDVHYGLATVCFLLNDLTSAAYHFKEVTRLDPLRAGAHINLGAVYNRLGMLDEAIPVLRRGIQLDHNRAEGYYNLGVVYRRKGQAEMAIQAYQEAVRINPRMADAHFNLGNLYAEKEQFALGLAHYKQAVELRPNWEKALNGVEQCEEMVQRTKASQNTNYSPPAATAHMPGIALDPQRVVDPEVQAQLLTAVHKATIDSDKAGQEFSKMLETEVEPAIKELSSCLLYPDTSITELDHCIQKFEAAINTVRTSHQTLHTAMQRVQKLGEELLRS
jgi:tetratricopeptide (TPR) repeat protein/exonuclease VII small subunit